MDDHRILAEARLKRLYSEVVRGLSLAALRNAEEIRDETRATFAEVRQRRLFDARNGRTLTLPVEPPAAPR